jgi:DNA-binding FadR family transcriptional regulator
VYDMLAAGDAAGAFAAMEEHIISGWKRRRRSISQDQDR